MSQTCSNFWNYGIDSKLLWSHVYSWKKLFFLSFHSASLLLREWERNIAKQQMSGANPKGIHHRTKHTRTPGKNRTLTFYVDEVRKSHWATSRSAWKNHVQRFQNLGAIFWIHNFFFQRPGLGVLKSLCTSRLFSIWFGQRQTIYVGSRNSQENIHFSLVAWPQE